MIFTLTFFSSILFICTSNLVLSQNCIPIKSLESSVLNSGLDQKWNEMKHFKNRTKHLIVAAQGCCQNPAMVGESRVFKRSTRPSQTYVGMKFVPFEGIKHLKFKSIQMITFLRFPFPKLPVPKLSCPLYSCFFSISANSLFFFLMEGGWERNNDIWTEI